MIDKTPNGVQSVDRALAILMLFSKEKSALGISEIADLLDLPKGSVHRLVASLGARGFVLQEGGAGKYRLGSTLAYLGNVALASGSGSLTAAALPIMGHLRDRYDETISLNVVQDNARVCIDNIESHQDVRTVAEIGRPYPLYAGASGKTLLAHLDPSAVDEVFRKAAKEAPKLGIEVNFHELRRQLVEIRNQGFAVSRKERSRDSVSASAPIRNYQGQVIAGLTISGPEFRIDDEMLHVFARDVVDAASRISETLGYFTAQGQAL